MTRNPSFSLAAIIALMIVAFAIAPSATAQSQTANSDTQYAPAWNLTDLQGHALSSAQFRGKVVILDFWATWCPPCRKEIPGLVALWQRYNKAGLVVVGVSMDQTGADTVADFAKRFRMTYPIALADNSIAQAYGGIDAIPTTFVIDRSGRVVSVHQGYTDEADFEREILPLLRKN